MVKFSKFCKSEIWPRTECTASVCHSHTEMFKHTLNHQLLIAQIQFTLIIHGFCICEFAYSLKFIFNPQINTLVLLWSFTDISREAKHLSCPTYMFSAEVKQAGTLPSYFSFYIINTCPFAV